MVAIQGKDERENLSSDQEKQPAQGVTEVLRERGANEKRDLFAEMMQGFSG